MATWGLSPQTPKHDAVHATNQQQGKHVSASEESKLQGQQIAYIIKIMNHVSIKQAQWIFPQDFHCENLLNIRLSED